MKRSEINQIIKEAKSFMSGKQFFLPPWAHWSVADWQKNKSTAEEITTSLS